MFSYARLETCARQSGRIGVCPPRSGATLDSRMDSCRKLENHAEAVALNYFAYNFIKIHRTLRRESSLRLPESERPWSVERFGCLLGCGGGRKERHKMRLRSLFVVFGAHFRSLRINSNIFSSSAFRPSTRRNSFLASGLTCFWNHSGFRGLISK
jgi:hypothetical protein